MTQLTRQNLVKTRLQLVDYNFIFYQNNIILIYKKNKVDIGDSIKTRDPSLEPDRPPNQI
jgi:hypothetical protein